MPLQTILFEHYATDLALIFMILLITLTLAEVISRRFAATIEGLSQVTHQLPAILEDGTPSVWPDSAITEEQQLINNFKQMATSLADKFQEVRQINESLEQRVTLRTQALSESESFNVLVLNSVPAAIAVLNRDGIILATNKSWESLASTRCLVPDVPTTVISVGSSYLAACVPGLALSVREGVKQVLKRHAKNFSVEYPLQHLRPRNAGFQSMWFPWNLMATVRSWCTPTSRRESWPKTPCAPASKPCAAFWKRPLTVSGKSMTMAVFRMSTRPIANSPATPARSC